MVVVIGKEPQYLPLLSIIKVVTAAEKPALQHDWHLFDEADGQFARKKSIRQTLTPERDLWGGARDIAKNIGMQTSCHAVTTDSSWFFFSKGLSDYRHLWRFFSLFFSFFFSMS